MTQPTEPTSPSSAPPRGAARALLAFALAAVTAFVVAVVCLLAAVLLVGSDRAVFGALGVALTAGALALPIAWLWLGRHTPDGDER